LINAKIVNASDVDLTGVALIFEVVDDGVQFVDKQFAILQLQPRAIRQLHQPNIQQTYQPIQ
jgi:hypothetical protein